MAIWQVVRASNCACYVVPSHGLSVVEDPTEEGLTKAIGQIESASAELAESLGKEEIESGETAAASKNKLCGVWVSGIYSTQQQAQNACNYLNSQGFCQGCL